MRRTEAGVRLADSRWTIHEYIEPILVGVRQVGKNRGHKLGPWGKNADDSSTATCSRCNKDVVVWVEPDGFDGEPCIMIHGGPIERDCGVKA